MVIGGRYTLISPVGTGGMGAVWRASDGLLRREVAIKEVVLPPEMSAAERDALTERTLREARAAAALSHPSVVRVFDVVTDGGRPWIVMELLKATSLADVIERDGPLAPRAVAKIGLAMLGALEAAHAAGVLHRDVKPGNVLICADGRCVLTDFGVARSATDVQMTSPGMVLGSPHFISPERATGGEFGPPSDLFSLGVTLYVAVEGRAPFDRGDAISTMHAVVNDPPEPPQRAGELTPILYGLLEKDPARRWDVDRTRAALRTLLLNAPTSQSTPVPSQPTAPLPTASVTPEPTPAQPATAMATSVMPASPAAAEPAATSWQARASVTPAEPVIPTQRGTAYQGYGAPPAPRSRTPLLIGAIAVAVVLALVLGAMVGSGVFDSEEKAPEAKPSPTGPPFPVRSVTEEGMTLNVPEDWVRQDTGNYVQYHHPDDQSAWLRLNQTNDSRPPRQILEGAEKDGFTTGAWGLTDYQRVALRDVELAGHPGAELEYKATKTSNGQPRRAIWRMIVVDGQNYQIYLSVPEADFERHLPVFEEAVRSVKLAG